MLLWHMSENVSPVFSFRRFIISCLIFKSLSHFKIIFVYDVRKCSNFKDLHVGVPISQHYLLKRLFSSLYILLEDCRRLIDLRSMCLFLDSLFYSIALYVCFYANILSFWLLNLCSIVWSLRKLSFQLFFPLRIALPILGLLWCHCC